MCGVPVIDADEDRGDALEEGRGRYQSEEQQMGPDGELRL